jgi:hypothetical protein
MLKARYGEDVVKRIEANLDVKTVDVQKKQAAHKRRGGDKKDRPQRPQK